MANLNAIYLVGQSLVDYLHQTYEAHQLSTGHPCTFSLFSSNEINRAAVSGTQVTLFLYRVTVNEHLRNMQRTNGKQASVPLSIDLHYLLTVWAEGALNEQVVLAWTMRQLHMHSVLDRSLLTGDADWDAGEVVQLIPAELSNEDVMRIWDALEPPYHLSVSYIARVIRIDVDSGEELRPVVDARFLFSNQGDRP